jgi:hypothetical protein
MIYAAAVVVLVGLATLIIALRGRRTDDHPVCRRCRFDLVGAPQGHTRCPECGSDTHAPGAVRIGNRRRRPRLAIAGVLLVLAGLIPLGVIGYGRAAGVNWNTYKPAWWLEGEIASSDQTTADAAVAEFGRRLADSTLSPKWRTRIIDHAMLRYVDEQADWSSAWSDLLGLAYTSDLLTDEQRIAYARHAPLLVLTGRPQAIAGENWMAHLNIQTLRTGRNVQLFLRVERLTGELNGQSAGPAPGGYGISNLGDGNSGSHGHTIPIMAEPGEYEFTSRWRFAVQTSHEETEPPIVAWEQEFRTPLKVLPPGSDLVQLVSDPRFADDMRRSIRLQHLSARGQPGAQFAGGTIFFDTPPVAAAFIMFWRYPHPAAEVGFREVRIGPVRGAVGSSHGTGIHAALPDEFSAEAVDVILRPDRGTGMQFIHVTEIWGDEIIIPDVKVLRPPPTPPPPPTRAAPPPVAPG